MVAAANSQAEPNRIVRSRRKLLPIPNPPNRRLMAIEPEERTEVEKVQHELVRDRRREDKKRGDGDPAKKDK